MISLNLGCGDKMINEDNWINVDLRKLYPKEAIFLRHDVRYLREKFQDGTVDEILMQDILEHFSEKEQRSIVKSCNQLLKKGGKIIVETPVIELLLKWAQTNSPEDVAHRIFGDQDYELNIHKWIWSKGDLLKLFRKSKFKILKTKVTDDTNIRLEAVK